MNKESNLCEPGCRFICLRGSGRLFGTRLFRACLFRTKRESAESQLIFSINFNVPGDESIRVIAIPSRDDRPFLAAKPMSKKINNKNTTISRPTHPAFEREDGPLRLGFLGLFGVGLNDSQDAKWLKQTSKHEPWDHGKFIIIQIRDNGFSSTVNEKHQSS